jgi:uncharacterized protein RhaS with RHS repeats
VLAPFRAYDPNAGRWISEDPIGAAGGLNLYAYVGGNPTRYVDPLGLALTSVDAAMRDAIMRGDVAEIQILLDTTGQSLSAGMRQAAQLAIQNESTTAGGMKSAAELAKHLDNVATAEEEAVALKEALQEASRRARDRIAKELEDLTNDIKGHLKEMKQKWGEFCAKK